MSKETVQFAEMARQGKKIHKNNLGHRYDQQTSFYCTECNEYKSHTLTRSGGWEYYTCECGNQQSFKVR